VGPAHLKSRAFPPDQILYKAIATHAQFLDLREKPLPSDYSTDDFMVLEGSDSDGDNLPPITVLPTERYFQETLMPFLAKEKAELSAVVLDVVDRYGRFTPRDMHLLSTRLRNPLLDISYRIGGPAEEMYGVLGITRGIVYPGVSGSPIFVMALKKDKSHLLVDDFGRPIILGITGGKTGQDNGAMLLTWSFRITEGAERLGYCHLDYSSGQPQWKP